MLARRSSRGVARAGACALLLLGALLVAPGVVPGGRAAAQGGETAPVAGVVRSPGGAVLVGAEVTLTPILPPGAAGSITFGRRLFTEDDGTFRATGLPTGRATLAVRRIGFRPVSREIAIPLAEPLAVVLEPVPQTMAAVVVRDRRAVYTGWAAPFYQRRDRGMGRFITRADIERRNPMRTTDLLRTVPGVAMMSTGRGYVLRMRGARCDPLVWIDGAPATAGYLDVDIFAPQTLEGVEVYNGVSSVPLELRGPRGEESCGVIALWSRVPDPRPRKARKPVTADDLAALVAAATVFTADQVERPAQADTANPFLPVYPDSLKQARVAGEAIVEFVVDTTGAPELDTVGIVAATHPLFARAARDAVAAARFLPASRAGRLVRQLVQVPARFEFSSRR